MDKVYLSLQPSKLQYAIILGTISSGETMARTLRPLSLGKILDETFDIYRHNFVLFLGISAIPNLVLLLLKIAAIRSGIDTDKTDSLTPILAGLVTWFASLFVEAIVTAATTFAVSDIYLDTPTSMVRCFSRVAGKALKVTYVSFVVALGIGFGFVFCIAPGIYWAGVYGIAIPAVVLENIRGRDAMSRSASLTKNSVGRIIVIYFLTAIFSGLMLVALSTSLKILGLAIFHTPQGAKLLEEITGALGAILFGPISAIALTLAYYDQRVRNEAFDIEHMMSLMGVQETGVQETGVQKIGEQESLPSTPPPPPPPST
jgi:hypothetical protein